MTDDPDSGLTNAVVVDTDVLSFWQKQDTRGTQYSNAIAGRLLVVSFQTVAELLRWAAEKDWGERRKGELEEYLKNFLIYSYSIELARQWADLMAVTSKTGRALKAGDAWIAATALLIEAPLATHNRRDFEGLPKLEIISFAPSMHSSGS